MLNFCSYTIPLSTSPQVTTHKPSTTTIEPAPSPLLRTDTEQPQRYSHKHYNLADANQKPNPLDLYPNHQTKPRQQPTPDLNPTSRFEWR